MPDEKEKAKGKMVDIDTSGPGAEVDLPEEKVKSVEQEETNAKTDSKDDNKSDDSSEKPDQQPDVQDSEQKTEEKVEEVKQTEQKKEMEDYGEGVQKRIAKLTKKMREAERQKEEAVSYARRVMRERDEIGRQASDLDHGYTSEMEGRIKSSLAAAQAKLSVSRDTDDKKAEVEALTAISQLGYEQAKLAEMKSRQQMEETARENARKQGPAAQYPTQRTPPPDPKAEDWAEKNNWFGKDNAMTYTAFDLHRKLTEEEGFDPKSDSYYEEIDKRIKLEFPHKFGKVEQQTSKPTQNVASATRSTKTGRKTVKLTSSQVAIAKKLRVPLEEYARQLRLTEGE